MTMVDSSHVVKMLPYSEGEQLPEAVTDPEEIAGYQSDESSAFIGCANELYKPETEAQVAAILAAAWMLPALALSTAGGLWMEKMIAEITEVEIRAEAGEELTEKETEDLKAWVFPVENTAVG